VRSAERAPAKLNLVLQVGRARPDGLHPLCSLFASIDLEDELELEPLEAGGRDVVECPGVEEPNLAHAALAALRERLGAAALPPLRVTIRKRIPVAAGLGGGSADAAAVLRAGNRLAGEPLGAAELRELGAELGSDVPSQVEPRHALVQGTGERVEPVELPPLAALLVPAAEGLSTASVYAELDRLGGSRALLDPEPLRTLVAGGAQELAAGVENDLQRAALSLRPELERTLAELRSAGALAAAVSGSGPTCFGLFEERAAAERAAAELPGSLPVELRS
jgi:4-diphosphocytidyl-2-C-methyl-D-erythritol kinase